MDKQHVTDFYNFRTRYLHEFNKFFEKIVQNFEKITQGKELDHTEKGTFKQYCILREIAALSPYIHLLDEKMLIKLPAETIHKCREIVDYFEQKKEELHFKPNFFAEEMKYMQLHISDYYLSLSQFISLELDFQIKEISKPNINL